MSPRDLLLWLAERWPAVAVGLVAVTFWPHAGSSFELPKLWVLGAFAVLALVSAFRARAPAWAMVPASLLAAALVATLAGEIANPLAVARELSVGAIVLGLSLRRVRPEHLVAPLAAAGSVVALVTLAQALGLELADAHAPGRLALFGTLGNPDFVAAFLAPVLALLVPRLTEPRGRRWALLAFALVALALAATRSLATLVSLGAAAAVFAVGEARRSRGGRMAVPDRIDREDLPLRVNGRSMHVVTAVLAVVEHVRQLRWRASTSSARARLTRGANRVIAAAPLLLVLAGCLALAWGRDWQRALDGRSYLLRVAAAPVLAHPLTGFGPGAVEALWPEWEAAAWTSGAFQRSQARFVDAQNHLHQDFLERAVEQGAFGLLALLATVGLALARLWRAKNPSALAAAAALVALLSRALVDFPLSRPAEAALFALLVAAGLSSSHSSQEPT